jgi:hypothetical protein
MSIYHICTDCKDKPDCDARHNPYDTECTNHDKFIEMQQRSMNSQYFISRPI